MLHDYTARSISSADIDHINHEIEQDIAQFGNPWPTFEPTEADFNAMIADSVHYNAPTHIVA